MQTGIAAVKPVVQMAICLGPPSLQPMPLRAPLIITVRSLPIAFHVVHPRLVMHPEGLMKR